MQTCQPNKMGAAPVGRLMLFMGLPMILSMMIQAFYNIVDSYFISIMPDTPGITGLGEYGVNALTLAFPIQMLMIAIFLGLCTYALFLLIGIFGIKPYLNSQTSDPIILQMGGEYLGICVTLSLGAIMAMIYEKLLQATGRTVLSTVAQLAGAVTNIVLDPIMIFGLWGCPALGIRGAAYATVIGQVLTLVLSLYFHHRYNKDVNASPKYLKPQGVIIVEIYKIGIPAIIMQALMSFMTYGVNIIFGTVSVAAVTAYGVYYRIQQFVFFAAFGLNNALIPIVAFNYGMGNRRRTCEGIKFGILYTLIIMLIGGIILQAFAKPIVGVFALSDSTMSLCVTAMRIITLGYLFVGANIAFQGIFQAFGCGMRSLWLSLVRLIIVTLPLAYFFTTFSGAEHLVWWAFPIAEACALLVALAFMRTIAKTKIASMSQPGAPVAPAHEKTFDDEDKPRPNWQTPQNYSPEGT